MRPTAVLVVVPVHDEEQTLAGCLTALDAARAHLAHRHPEVTASVTVVLDRCRDASAAIAARHDVDVLALDAGNVGTARAAGVAHARRTTTSADLVWVATTDADSRVPECWLTEQVVRADAGHDLVVGSVVPELGELAAPVHEAWLARHSTGARHVFGASLGFRLSAYDAGGGFAPVGLHEDTLLVDALLARGVPWTSGTCPVITSARTVGRASGGFADYVRRLHHELVEPDGDRY